MSEEQPTFKVKDRRLFNPDGTPREVERDEQSESSPGGQASPALPGGATTKASAAPASPEDDVVSFREPVSDARSSPATPPRGRTEESSRRAAAAAPPPDEPAQEEDIYGEDVPGANDPASFINFLMSIASNAAAALGMMEHPVTGQRGVDLPLAKHWIDVLGMLQQKTRGNLALQEQQIFEGLLSDLRMQYVSLTSAAPPATGRAFTGRDIIGGK